MRGFREEEELIGIGVVVEVHCGCTTLNPNNISFVSDIFLKILPLHNSLNSLNSYKMRSHNSLVKLQ